MVQIPKGRFVKGPYKSICRDCAIYFSMTVYGVYMYYDCIWCDSTCKVSFSNKFFSPVNFWDRKKASDLLGPSTFSDTPNEKKRSDVSKWFIWQMVMSDKNHSKLTVTVHQLMICILKRLFYTKKINQWIDGWEPKRPGTEWSAFRHGCSSGRIFLRVLNFILCFFLKMHPWCDLWSWFLIGLASTLWILWYYISFGSCDVRLQVSFPSFKLKL